LGKHDVGHRCRPAEDDIQIVAPVRMGHVVDAGAERPWRLAGSDQVSDHLGVLVFRCPAGAPSSQSAVMSNIGPMQLGLQLQRLADQFFSLPA
jgi:hypothetical protein